MQTTLYLLGSSIVVVAFLAPVVQALSWLVHLMRQAAARADATDEQQRAGDV